MKRNRWTRFTALCCALTLALSLTPTALAAGFSDVPASHWAYQAIMDAASSGITGGYSDGTFKPDGEVTGAQFAAFLARAFYGCPIQSTSDPWYQTYLDALSADGVLKDTAAENNSAALKKSLSRYDMALMLYHILSAKGNAPSESQRKAAQKNLSDWNSIPAKYRDAVASCAAAGILNGTSDGSFAGANLMKRAHACSVISRLDQLLSTGKASTPAKPASTPAAKDTKPDASTTASSDRTGQLRTLINDQRSKAGLPALTASDALTKAAQERAKDLSQGCIETRPDGSDWGSVLNKYNISASEVDESIAGGNGVDAADAVLSVLLSTPEAKATLYSTAYDCVGVGYCHTENGYGGFKDFWSILYIKSTAPSTSTGAPVDSGTLSFTPVPVEKLANKKSLQKKATNEQLTQAYNEAVKLVEPYANLPMEQKLQGICSAIRERFDNGMSYSMETDHYNDPYGYFIQGSASCAGCTRATGLCLNILGIPYEHVNENQYTHQWCRVNVNGTYWICDPYGLCCGPEPAPYTHPYF